MADFVGETEEERRARWLLENTQPTGDVNAPTYPAADTVTGTTDTGDGGGVGGDYDQAGGVDQGGWTDQGGDQQQGGGEGGYDDQGGWTDPNSGAYYTYDYGTGEWSQQSGQGGYDQQGGWTDPTSGAYYTYDYGTGEWSQQGGGGGGTPEPEPEPEVITLPGGAIDPDSFQNMFSTAFETAWEPYQQQFSDYGTQIQNLQNQYGQQGSGVSQGLVDILGNLLSGQGGYGQQAGGGTVDMSGLLGGQQSIMDLLTNMQGGQGGQGGGEMPGFPGGTAPQDPDAPPGEYTPPPEENVPGGGQQGIPSYQDILGGMYGQVGAGAQQQQTQFTPEQMANIFGGTGDQNQMPGFMYGPDYFRGGTDYMTELAAGAPSADVMGAMGDVLSGGPSSYGQLGDTLSGLLSGMGSVDTAPYQQLLESGMSRIGEEEQRAIDQEMLRFNRMGLTPENVASGTIIDPLSRTRERFAQTRGDLMSQLSLQQGQREDMMRQAQSQGYQGLMGLQQAGQGQTAAGLGNLAQMLQSQQAQQLAGIGGVQQQAWQQNVQDMGLQNMFMQQEQQRRDQLMNQLLGQTQPTMPSMPGIAGPNRQQGGGFGGALGGMAGMLAGSVLGPFGSAAGGALGNSLFGGGQ